MLSKSSFFTTILLLLPALASAQTADDDLQLELRYYAPKLKFTSHGIVPAAYSNFRDTLNIKNGNAPEYRLSGKNWYVITSLSTKKAMLRTTYWHQAA